MAETGRTRLPVVERGESRRLVGIVSLTDLLQARTRNLEAERRRERVLGPRVLFPARPRDTSSGAGGAVA
jgi:CIC family chloride channel protein